MARQVSAGTGGPPTIQARSADDIKAELTAEESGGREGASQSGRDGSSASDGHGGALQEHDSKGWSAN